jgi:hypothetical protein
MKRIPFWDRIALLLFAVISSSALAASSSNVILTFAHPEHFTDFRIQGRIEQESAVKFAAEMSAALAPTVAQQAPGSTLVLQFTDIDLGGRYEPQKTGFTNTRFYHNGREPVRMYFNYTLTDARGRVLAKGSDSATDTVYLGKYTSEPAKLPFEEFYFEKQTLIAWIKNKIGGPDLNPTVKENVSQMGLLNTRSSGQAGGSLSHLAR